MIDWGEEIDIRSKLITLLEWNYPNHLIKNGSKSKKNEKEEKRAFHDDF